MSALDCLARRWMRGPFQGRRNEDLGEETSARISAEHDPVARRHKG
ncbi:hypothetical protein ACNF49_44045 [Actinomadura sp. ATCC 39365]